MARENELLQNKLKQAIGERIRICGMLDTKCKELAEFQKEVERLKEDLSVKDVKLKWSQTKFKTEMEMQRETQQKLDKAIVKNFISVSIITTIVTNRTTSSRKVD